MLRTGYTTRVRPWRDDAGDVEIRWYKCPPGAKELGVPSLFRPLHWESHPYLFAGGLGEVFNAPVKVRPHPAPPGVKGDHHCGDDRSFRDGGLRNTSEPPFERADDGIPECCRGPVGGLVWGGPLPDLGGLVMDGGTYPVEERNAATNCIAAGFFPMPTDGRLVFFETVSSGTLSNWVMMFQSAGTENVEVTYTGGPAGGVARWRVQYVGQVCADSTIVAEWPSDQPDSRIIDRSDPNAGRVFFEIRMPATLWSGTWALRSLELP